MTDSNSRLRIEFRDVVVIAALLLQFFAVMWTINAKMGAFEERIRVQTETLIELKATIRTLAAQANANDARLQVLEDRRLEFD